jgi:uncharacterized protein (TIGR02646 family)
MRTIRKHPQPNSLTLWRVQRSVPDRSPGLQCNYDELRRAPCWVEVENGLFHEQGGICAYTGLRLRLVNGNADNQPFREVDFHIEHLTPQEHCCYGEEAKYDNMVACWPKPNVSFEPKYGARKKGNWPPAQESSLFVSPLRHDCSDRFLFNHKGEIFTREGDEPAKETIRRLGLDHKELTALRRQEIIGVLNPRGKPIGLGAARKLRAALDREAADLDAGRSVQLMAFCFAIRPAIDRQIRKLEGIRGSRR